MNAHYVKVDIPEGIGYLVQVDNPSSQWGFYLADDDQTWDGGFGIAKEWHPVKASEVPAHIRKRIGPLYSFGD
jgi:hypothetical protein